MPTRLAMVLVMTAGFLCGGAAAWEFLDRPVRPATPTIMVVRIPPYATLRDHGWELTVPAPGPDAECVRHDNCNGGAADDDDDDSDVISI